MARRLIIVRHAKAAPASAAANDFGRPLATRGEQAATAMGGWLSQQGYVPDHVLSSPALRARQTTERMCKAMHYDAVGIVWEQAIYEATVAEILAVLARVPTASSTVMLVGHNPGLEDLVRHLARAADLDVQADKLLPTGAAYVLELPKRWIKLPAGAAPVLAHMSPRRLGAENPS